VGWKGLFNPVTPGWAAAAGAVSAGAVAMAAGKVDFFFGWWWFSKKI